MDTGRQLITDKWQSWNNSEKNYHQEALPNSLLIGYTKLIHDYLCIKGLKPPSYFIYTAFKKKHQDIIDLFFRKILTFYRIIIDKLNKLSDVNNGSDTFFDSDTH